MLKLMVLTALAVVVGSPVAGALVAPQISERQNPACENTATSRACWGDFSIDTDYYDNTPKTGQIREYWLSTEMRALAPDGYEREVMVFNGTLPGPTIEADWGDELIIHVTNNIPNNGATQYGTSWYHSHFSLQLAEGLFGPIVIHGPTTANYDVDLGPVLIGDWSHVSAFQIWEETQRVLALKQPVAENGLINGLNPYDCTRSRDPACIGTTDRFEVAFEKGKKYLLRVVGVQVDGYMKFTIDGHRLTVIATDFVPIQPYETDSIILASGQRYDVIVEADQKVDSYWLRAIYQTACNNNDNESKDNILGVVRYEGTDVNADPSTRAHRTITNSCGDEPYENLVPWVSHQVGASDIEDYLILSWYYQLDLVFHWTLRTKTLIVDWAKPTVIDIYNGVTKYPTEGNVVTIDAEDQWVYWVVQDLTLVDAFHPFHLHGHDFYVLAQGEGPFIPGLVKLNRNNPPRRDTVSLYGNGYAVIAFKTDNPGSWLFHCHIAWHASQGLAMQLIERPGDLSTLMEGEVDGLNKTCNAWVPFYNSPAQADDEQDDSGI
ncbi:hypothetical protein JX266_009389 [Neoarthrinium moseri]|nr:hypothetical protein JX266_009389 [Neoarthrinium moseri]